MSNKSVNEKVDGSSDAKVLEFPKAQSIRKRLMDRSQDQKAVLGLSIVSVLVMTVFLNEWIVKSQNGIDAGVNNNRGIASFEDLSSVESIQWEHELAQKLSQEKDVAKSLLAAKPTLKDELVFGFLEGKYRTRVANNRIQGFEFTTASAEGPLVIKEKGEFLKIFKSVFSVPYAKVQLDRREGKQEFYKLLSASNQSLGQALFSLDDEGRVLSLSIQ
ncbi:MAG: hypothetical protein EOP09_06665 [Proteobacteria bacterium]|nr:MAG: hypothetical protein EOP09_06665 [Pseudomonadota bacterium]